MRYLASALLFLSLAASLPVRGAQLGDLPGEDVSSSGGEVEKSQSKVTPTATQARRAENWLAPGVNEQLSRDRILIPLGKGALFVPTYSEPRREPEVSAIDARGKLARTGQTGERILLDSGSYTVRIGSGTGGQQISVRAVIEEGHTTVVPPQWGGLIVETLSALGEYIEGEYEVIRMEGWINYGKGRGLREERLQDIKTWLLPPGMYRISKPGEGFNSLRNYITVQVNSGELKQVELVYDKAVAGDIVSGGSKALNARARVGRNWRFGVRAGGNVNLARQTDDAGIRKESMQVSSDLRARALFDNVKYLGSSEIFLQDNFSKEKGRRFNVLSDIAQVRTNWTRRLTPWLGPYMRATVETNIFPRKAIQDTVKIATMEDSSGTMVRRIQLDTSGDFVIAPGFDPIKLGQGAGVNIEFISKYYLEAATQMGLAARQTLVKESYGSNPQSEYSRNQSIYEIGAESNLNATLRLGDQMALDLRLELFAPNANPSRLRLDDFTADFRFLLSRNLELGYLYQVSETQRKARNRYPSFHNVSLRLSFNY